MRKEQILQQLHNHKEVFKKFGISEVGLFGSYSRDEQSDGSDVDILIDFFSGQENFDNLMAAYDFAETLFPGKKIELVTKNGLSPHIGPAIFSQVLFA